MDAIDEDWTTGDVQQLCVRTGHSRFPVRRGAAYIGYVHVKDTLGDDLSRPLRRERIRELGVVPAGTPLDDVLEAMQRARAHLAVVDDREPGEPVPRGLLVLEDVLAELVGEVRDATPGADQ